ncbi:MAG: DUF2914 domain-containing protein [Minisyncoccia bacterium]
MSLSHLRKKVSKPVVKWYGRYERPISSFSLVGGFIFDALTLKRVDEVWENIWVMGHIVLIVIVMFVINRLENFPGDEKNPEKIHFWLVNTLQFLFGGVLSVFLIFYFRSAELSTSWPFILILILVFWANEALKSRFVRLTFQVTILFLSIFSSMIYFLPVLMHRIGPDVFIYSGLISLGLIAVFLIALSKIGKEKFKKSRHYIYLSIASIYIVFNFLYFTNLIPPLPLSLEDSGLYSEIVKENGDYLGTHRYLGLISNILIYPKVSFSDAGSVYAYSAIFSPAKFDTSIIHEWQYYDATNKSWRNHSAVDLRIVGGRDGGFRTYSNMDNITLGKWRVNVLTLSRQVIGRIRFEVVPEILKGEIRTDVLK